MGFGTISMASSAMSSRRRSSYQSDYNRRHRSDSADDRKRREFQSNNRANEQAGKYSTYCKPGVYHNPAYVQKPVEPPKYVQRGSSALNYTTSVKIQHESDNSLIIVVILLIITVIAIGAIMTF